MSKYFPVLGKHLTALVAVLRITWFIPAFIGTALVLFTTVDQTEDIFRALATSYGEFPFWQNFCLLFFMATWSIACWYSSRLLLLLSNKPEDIDTQLIKRYEEWVPRVYGILPAVVVVMAMPNSDNYLPTMGEFFSIVWAVLFSVFMIFRKHRTPSNSRFRSYARPFKDLSARTRRWVWFSESLWAIWLILFSIRPTAIPISQFMGTAGLLFLFLSTWTVFFMAISYLDQRYKAPIMILITLFAVLVVSRFNDNHAIRYLEDRNVAEFKDYSLTPEHHMHNWLLERQSEWANSQSDYPVIIVSAEGGGIRSAYWTACVLGQLEQELPGLTNHIYGMSGISGGSLGATTYNALYKDLPQMYPDGAWRDSLVPKAKAFLKNDFLSPLMAGLLYPDLVQKVIPARINAFDRAKWLEDSWKKAYAHHMDGRTTFGDGFLGLWEGRTYDMPSLFINSTRVETGQWFILSNLVLEDSVLQFENDIDLLDTVGYDLPLMTATLMSARFPILTPPGSITHSKSGEPNDIWTHGVDGGFLGNSGLENAMKVVANMNNAIRAFRHDSVPGSENLRVIVLMIQNGTPPDYSQAPTIRRTYELKAPLDAFLNGWANGMSSDLVNTQSFFENSEIPGELRVIQLDRTEGSIPLGWFLSPEAQDNLNAQVARLTNLPDSISSEVARDNHAVYEHFKEMMEGLAENPATSPADSVVAGMQ